jgi:hypothetical protein
MARIFAQSFAVGALLATAAFSSAQVTKSGNGYLFKVKYQAGKETAYKVDTNTAFGGQKMNILMSYTQKVQSVKNGIAKVDLTMSPPTMNGQTMATGQQMQTASMSVDTLGKTVDGMNANPGGSMNFAAKPIPIGGTWSGKTSLGAVAGKGGSVDATYKLVKITTYRGKSVAVIQSSMKMTGMGAMSGSGVSYVDMADGSLIDSNLTMNVAMPAGAAGAAGGDKPMNITAKIIITRTK